MIKFAVVPAQDTKIFSSQGWAIERTDPNGFRIVVSMPFQFKQEAENEAARLNREASRRFIG